MDVKRIGYLLVLALAIGVGLVHLRTAHRRAMCQMWRLARCEQQVRNVLWDRQVLLSAQMESPGPLKERIAQVGASVRPRHSDPEAVTVVAKQ